MTPPRPSRMLAVALLLRLALGAPLRAGGAGTEDEARAQRVLSLLRAVAEEYREAVDETGRVTRPLEIEEARLFLAEARDHGGRLAAAPADLSARLDRLGHALEHGPLATLEAEVDGLCAALVAATGVHEELLPPASPSATHGAAVYGANCVGCHGATGAGDGRDAVQLEVKPADFTDPTFMRGETPADFFHVITVGRRRAAMPAWGDGLTVQERWDTIAFLWDLHTIPSVRAEGRGLYLAHCAGCHGAAGDGHGALAPAVGAPVPDLAARGALILRTDAELLTLVTDGVPGTPMPGFARVLDLGEREKLVAYVRALSLGAGSPPRARDREARAETPFAMDGVLRDVRRLLDEAVATHAAGAVGAGDLVTDAYLRFEPLEPRIGARDPAAVRRVEEAFLALRMALRRPGADVEALAAETRAALDAASTVHESPADAWVLFLQSAAIILREGFEVVLILGALLAYVAKTGNAAMRRPILGGAGLGVVASGITAVLLMRVFRPAPGTGELLEGAAMLLAAVVLFWVSYWIVSKAEAERWQRYIQGKVDRALAAGSVTALTAAAFLAVYREGFETVLFYQALLATAPAGDLMVPAGLAAGAAVLAAVYLGLRRFGMRVPIRPFFLVTGGLLTVMAIAFAGRGVSELQEAGVVAMTPVAWVPRMEFLGVFPSVETLAAQGVLVLLVLWGLAATIGGRGPRQAELETIRREIVELRRLAEALRDEIAQFRAVDGAAALGRRVEGLLGRVQALERRVVPANGRP